MSYQVKLQPAGLEFSAVQAKRKCGTSCGSCVPELQRLLRAAQQA